MATESLSPVIEFRINLDNPDARTYGPLFHRWLPNGKADAISIDVGEGLDLKVWFKRLDDRDNNAFYYIADRANFAEQEMSFHGRLDAGELHCRLVLNNLDDAGFASIASNDYESVGKQALRAVEEPLHNFIAHLRTVFGQAWLPRQPPWDSRKESVSAHWLGWDARFSTDGEQTWSLFVPGHARSTMTGIVHDRALYKRYITEQDWRSLNDFKGDRPSFALDIISEANGSLATSDLKLCLIESATALEIALDEFIHVSNKSGKDPCKVFPQISNAALPVKIGCLVALRGDVSPNIVTSAIEAIRMRNDVIHEGRRPEQSELRTACRALLRLASNFCSPSPRLVSPMHSCTSSDEDWDKL